MTVRPGKDRRMSVIWIPETSRERQRRVGQGSSSYAPPANLRAQMDAAEKPTKQLTKDFAQTERQAAALTNRLDAGGVELQQLSNKLSAAGIDVGYLARYEERLSSKPVEATPTLRQQTAQLEKVRKAKRNSEKLNSMSTNAAARAPVVAAVKQAMSVAAIAPMLTHLDGLRQRLALVGNTSRTAGSMHEEFLTHCSASSATGRKSPHNGSMCSHTQCRA